MRFPDWYFRGSKVDGAPVDFPPSPIYSLVFPPVGFWPLVQLGNGDELGFYWPLGCENVEPIIVETAHDVWGLVPVARTLPDYWIDRSAMDREGYTEETYGGHLQELLEGAGLGPRYCATCETGSTGGDDQTA